MARRLRNIIACTAWTNESASTDIDRDPDELETDDYDVETSYESGAESNRMPYRAIVKMVSGRCLAKDFDSEESARSWLDQYNLLIPRTWTTSLSAPSPASMSSSKSSPRFWNDAYPP